MSSQTSAADSGVPSGDALAIRALTAHGRELRTR
jgi:hypothetical protein